MEKWSQLDAFNESTKNWCCEICTDSNSSNELWGPFKLSIKYRMMVDQGSVRRTIQIPHFTHASPFIQYLQYTLRTHEHWLKQLLCVKPTQQCVVSPVMHTALPAPINGLLLDSPIHNNWLTSYIGLNSSCILQWSVSGSWLRVYTYLSCTYHWWRGRW